MRLVSLIVAGSLAATLSSTARADDALVAKADQYWHAINDVASKIVWKRTGSPQCIGFKTGLYSILLPQLDEDRSRMYRTTDPKMIQELETRLYENQRGTLIQIEYFRRQGQDAGCLLN